MLKGRLEDDRMLTGRGRYVSDWNLPGQAYAHFVRSDRAHAEIVSIDTVSNSPYGLVGPKGMPEAVVKRLHDAFKLAIDDPEHLKTLQQPDQLYWYKSSEDYAKWAAETFKAERATIERVGLLAK